MTFEQAIKPIFELSAARVDASRLLRRISLKIPVPLDLDPARCDVLTTVVILSEAVFQA
jgi:hypothetical protein